MKGDFATAEAALFRGNAQRPGTLQWDIEAAGKLAHLALGLREHYDHRNAIVAGQRALAQLNDGLAQRSAGISADYRVQLYLTAAFINEEILFDRAAAKAALLQAQLINPSSQAVAAALEKIVAQEAVEARVRGGRN
jgi:hypothetical protein